MEILLLEDDQILSESLQLFLHQEGFSVDTALSLEEAEELTYEKHYDLYLLDINLPEGNGLEFLKALRHAEDHTPTIFLTALTDLYSIAQSFDLGAIDYIKKPFDPQELLIRLKAKFKREILIHHHIAYDPKTKLLRKNGKIIDIGNVQHNIFVKLLEKRGEIVTKPELYECLDHVSNTALRVAITKIKQRLEVEIKNIRGKGYLIETI